MTLGTLNEKFENNIMTVTGKISTYAVALRFRLEPRDSMKDEKSPSHDVIGQGAHGGAFNAGVAWQGNVQSKGTRMYSLALNIPELFKEELKLVAWENEKQPGTFDIQYSKDKEQPKQATAA